MSSDHEEKSQRSRDSAALPEVHRNGLDDQPESEMLSHPSLQQNLQNPSELQGRTRAPEGIGSASRGSSDPNQQQLHLRNHLMSSGAGSAAGVAGEQPGSLTSSILRNVQSFPLPAAVPTNPSTVMPPPQPMVSNLPPLVQTQSLGVPITHRSISQTRNVGPEWRLFAPIEERTAVRRKLRKAYEKHARGDLDRLLTLVAAIDEELIFASAGSRLDYFQEALEFDKRIALKLKHLEGRFGALSGVKRNKAADEDEDEEAEEAQETEAEKQDDASSLEQFTRPSKKARTE